MVLEVPIPLSHLVAFSIGIFIGMWVPTYYGMERLRGFGRALASRLPYEPPPGQEAGKALEEAVDEDNN